MRTAVSMVLFAAALAGCTSTGGMGRMNTYKFPVHKVALDGDTYRVYDHKTDNALMVSPGLGKIVAVGATKGATLGMVNTMTPEQKLRAAAQKHLNDTGRTNCTIVRGGLLQQPMYEFWFECAATGGDVSGG